MFRHKMDLMIKACIMPLSEYEFYKVDHIENLIKKEEIEEYNKYLNTQFLECIYRIISRTKRIYNLDEIDLLIKKFYPKTELNKSGSANVCYMTMLSKLSKSFISHRNGRIALKYWECSEDEGFIGPYKGLNKIALWNSLNRMFTTDILAVRYLLDNDMKEAKYLNGYYSNIMLEDLQLEQILKRGVAETHIHRGAAISFNISWQNVMNLTGKNRNFYKQKMYTDVLVGKNFGLENYIMAIAIVRLLMATYIDKHLSNFCEYINNWFDVKTCSLIIDVFEGKEISNEKYDFFSIWERIKEKLGIYVNNNLDKKASEEDVLINVFNAEKNINTTSENIFLFKSMKYIDDSQEDYFFTKLFWQYIRIKNELFQLTVQDNLVRGLKNFQNYYRRSTALEGYTSKEYWKLILQNQFQNIHLKKLELRISFEKGISIGAIKRNLKKALISFFEAYKEILEKDIRERNSDRNSKKKEIPSVGLVFHMIKEFDKKENEKCWQNYNGNEDCELYFREIQEKYRKQIIALNEIREEICGLSDYIVGIDAASIENDTEPWVFAPIYELARDSSTHKLIYENSNKYERIKNLGFTFHAGEDFRHFLTGIRRVDEVVEHFKFHAGDRIGHGISLGLDIGKWIENNKVVVIPRIEHLENLLWVWGIYKDGRYVKCFDNVFLEQEIMKHAQKVYENVEGITTYNLWRAYRNKFKTFKTCENFKLNNEDKNNKLFCKFVAKGDSEMWNEEKLTHAQHCKCYLERMMEPVQIEVKSEEIEMFSQIQRIVASKISKEGIIVEANPSSNVAIGEIENIFEHYIFKLNKRGLGGDVNPENAVMISINSDDPSVFNTNVSNEFAYIFYSLQEKGYSREDVLLWIDKIRSYGMDSCFIADRDIGAEELRDEIYDILDGLRR